MRLHHQQGQWTTKSFSYPEVTNCFFSKHSATFLPFWTTGGQCPVARVAFASARKDSGTWCPRSVCAHLPPAALELWNGDDSAGNRALLKNWALISSEGLILLVSCTLTALQITWGNQSQYSPALPSFQVNYKMLETFLNACSSAGGITLLWAILTF